MPNEESANKTIDRLYNIGVGGPEYIAAILEDPKLTEYFEEYLV